MSCPRSLSSLSKLRFGTVPRFGFVYLGCSLPFKCSLKCPKRVCLLTLHLSVVFCCSYDIQATGILFCEKKSSMVMVQRYALSSYKNFMACVVLRLKIRLLHSLEHNHLMLSNPSYFSAANCKFINYLYEKKHICDSRLLMCAFRLLLTD